MPFRSFGIALSFACLKKQGLFHRAEEGGSWIMDLLFTTRQTLAGEDAPPFSFHRVIRVRGLGQTHGSGYRPS